MSTAHTTVLREPDAAVGNELTCFDLSDSGFNQAAVLPALLIGNRGPEILNLRLVLSNEHNHGDFGDSADPGVADELRIKREQPLGLFRITARRSLPINNTGSAVELSESVDVRNEFVVSP